MKKKMIPAFSLLLVAILVAGGFYYKHEKEKQIAERTRIEAERLEKLEAEEKAKELAEKEEKIKAQLAKEEKEREARKLAEEKAKLEAQKKAEAEAKKKAELKAQEEAKKEEATVVVNEPKSVAPLTATTSKKNVTEKAKVVPVKKQETKVAPKPKVETPPADLVEHQKEVKEAEAKQPENKPISNNIFADPSNPDNPFNYIEIPEVSQGLQATPENRGMGFDKMGTGDKF